MVLCNCYCQLGMQGCGEGRCGEGRWGGGGSDLDDCPGRGVLNLQ